MRATCSIALIFLLTAGRVGGTEFQVIKGVTSIAVTNGEAWTGGASGLGVWDKRVGAVRLLTDTDPSQIMVVNSQAGELLVAGGWPGESGWLGVRAPDVAPLHISLSPISNTFADTIVAADWSEATQRWALACLDGQAAVINSEQRKVLTQFTGHSAGVTSIAWIDDNLVASGGRDHTIRIWLANDGKLIRTLNNHTDEVVGLASRPGNNGMPWLASIARDRTIRFWQPTIGRLVRFFRLEEGEPTCLAWTIDGEALWVGTSQGKMLKVDPNTAQVIEHVQVADDWITTISIMPDSTVIVGVSE